MNIQQPIKWLMVAALLAWAWPAAAQVSDVNFTISEGTDDDRLKEIVENNVNNLIGAMMTAAQHQRKNVKLPDNGFSEDAKQDLKKLWRNSPMSVPAGDISCRLLNTTEGFQVRNIPVDMLNDDPGNPRQAINIDFEPNGRVCQITLAVDVQRYEQIMTDYKDDVDYARRQRILAFIENFRTAYNKKDLDLISSVYSDNALIITGRVVSVRPNSRTDRVKLINNKVIYTSQNKTEYLTKLARIFKRNKYINLTFEDIDVTRHPKYSDVYGVTLKQYWDSSTYSDVGYLFLIIDFRYGDDPLIQVRTWQPYKDSAGNIVTTEDDIFRIGQFNLNRK